jgi:acyl-coenzyme A thioesterase PaaI-like protein
VGALRRTLFITLPASQTTEENRLPPQDAAERSLAAKSRKLRRGINLYPPYLGAAVRVTHISDDFRRIDVTMPLRFYNRNYFGTHFGGSLYSMCDPFYVLMLANILGHDYIVWDKAANIRFKKPGKGVMKASFQLTEEKIAEIRAAAETQSKVEHFSRCW